MNTTLIPPVDTLPVDFPRAKTRRPTSLWLIWAVPVIAAAVSGLLIFQNLQKFGPSITIEFDNANGLDANQTVIRYRGVKVGNVQSIQLAKDLQHVEVRARLIRSAAGLARSGSVFWVVRPEVGAAGVHALETIVSGPYIEALPGVTSGQPQKQFLGANESPIIKQGNGTEFILRSSTIRSLGANSPVYFRGLPVGKVQYLELSPDSTTVNIHVFVKANFAPLVRANTVWWNAGGIEINWHLRSGLSMAAENLRSVLTGGISFATPNDTDDSAPAGTIFELHAKPDEKWLAWAPHITITNNVVSLPGSQAIMELENASQVPK